MISAVLIFNNHGKPRVNQFYQHYVSSHESKCYKYSTFLIYFERFILICVKNIIFFLKKSLIIFFIFSCNSNYSAYYFRLKQSNNKLSRRPFSWSPSEKIMSVTSLKAEGKKQKFYYRFFKSNTVQLFYSLLLSLSLD